jgi:hypothetical protein
MNSADDFDKVWCVDCVMNPLPIRWRPASYPGPRCATHYYQALRQRKIRGPQ